MIKKTTLALFLAVVSGFASAQNAAEYDVFITNITPGQTFTPQLVLTHSAGFRMFGLGLPASEPLEMLAEGGATGPLTEQAGSRAMDAQTIDGLLGPGQTVRTVVTGIPGRGFISVAAMLIPTNDAFMALNRLRLPSSGSSVNFVPAYDAGTELNDQSCQNIPGPRCGGEGYSDEAGEGYVHIGNGFHELGEMDDDGFEVLGPQVYDWRNSVARIVVRRIE